MLADSEHDKKVEDNVKECLERAKDKCSRLRQDLVRERQRYDNSATEEDTLQPMPEALDQARAQLRSRDAEIASLKMRTPVRNPEPQAAHTPRGKAQAVRDISRLLQNPLQRGTEELERSLDELMQLPDLRAADLPEELNRSG